LRVWLELLKILLDIEVITNWGASVVNKLNPVAKIMAVKDIKD
jgi:hypothetical protein